MRELFVEKVIDTTGEFLDNNKKWNYNRNIKKLFIKL